MPVSTALRINAVTTPMAAEIANGEVVFASEHIGSGMAQAGLTVSAVNGRIILAGVTSSGSLCRRAEQLTCTIEGVHNIDNLIVSVPSGGRGS